MNLNLAVTYGPVSGFPAGSVVAAIQSTITGTAAGNTTPVVQSVAPGTATITFVVTVADTYTYSIAGVDGSSPPNAYAPAVTGSFVITQPTTVTLTLPVSALASQS
jgi:hypothetical protein